MLVSFVVGAELTARVDDYVHYGVRILASPDRERDLVTRERWGYRGKSGGLYQKWKLNSFGFRGPEISREPEAGTTRVVILGSSESFGLLESPDHEYPAQLRTLLDREGRYEVVNASLVGMSLKSMMGYWDNWVSRFHPHIVLICPSPIIYLRNDPPFPPPLLAENEITAADAEGISFRLVERAVGVYRSLPLRIRNIRRDWLLNREIAAKGAEWLFDGVPEDRLNLFHDDALQLIEKIRDGGATPMLVTYAMSASSPPRSEDLVNLQSMRRDFPRATVDVIAEFEVRANAVLRQIARDKGLGLVDVGGRLNGRRELFGDLCHFKNAGAAEVALLMKDAIIGEPAAVGALSDGGNRDADDR